MSSPLFSIRRSQLVAPFALLALGLAGCPKKADGPDAGPPAVARCEVDLGASGLFAQTGTGASAARVDSKAMLIGGEGATGTVGDVLLQNDRIRVIIEQPRRTTGPMLSGGGIVDADLVRPAGAPGQDAFGRMGLFYALGRFTSVTDVEVLADGAAGGPAIVAATGHDAQHDLINLESVVRNNAGLNLRFVLDPKVPLPIRSTTYYVLSPGESRVRVLTAFCNEGSTPVQAPLLELTDTGTFGLFIPDGCSNGLGANGINVDNCLVQSAPWIASQGAGIAYGLRSYQYNDPTKPVTDNAVLGYGGVVGYMVQGHDLNGLVSWADAEARTRPGEFAIRGGGQRTYLRDFFVGADIAGISSEVLALDGAARGRVDVTATLPGGAAAAGARVSIKRVSDAHMVTLIEADGQGLGHASLPPGEYLVSGALEGRLVGPEVRATVTAGGTAAVAVALAVGRTLTVTLKDPFGAAMPGKLMVLCKGGTCPFDAETFKQHFLFDKLPTGAGAVAFVPPSGTLAVTLPPAEYEVVLSRGPEYSTWPDTWPTAGFAVDLRTADQAIAPVLGHVVDSPGWVSADLHVHAWASSDSAVGNEVRAANFMAEGVDVLLSTDHEVITDFAPAVKALGGDPFIATMIGEEVTSFTHGHFNAFPLTRLDQPNGGAFDHAGGEDGPTLRLPQLFPGIHAAHPGSVVQINHPRGGSGALTNLKVDTATLTSHGLPEDYLMAAAPDATADDTRLFDASFDALETANGASPSFGVLNDWMTFLSRGTVKAATGVSDTHKRVSDHGGYMRTYAKVGTDAPADFKPLSYADAVRGRHLMVSNGPYLHVTARKLDAAGAPTGAAVEVGDTLSIAGAAGEGVQLTVDVQGVDWMQFDRVELYTHSMGREALNGETNGAWPESRIAEKHLVNPQTLTLEAVSGMNGLTLRRVHHTDTFTVHPVKDTWYVVMVRGTGRSMFPLHTTPPIAYTNALLVDADGSGAYDDFPLKAQRSRHVFHPPTVMPPHTPTADEFARAIVKILEHKHE